MLSRFISLIAQRKNFSLLLQPKILNINLIIIILILKERPPHLNKNYIGKIYISYNIKMRLWNLIHLHIKNTIVYKCKKK